MKKSVYSALQMKKISFSYILLFFWMVSFFIFIYFKLTKLESSSYNTAFYFLTFSLAFLFLEFKLIKNNDGFLVIWLSYLGGAMLTLVFGPMNDSPPIIDFFVCTIMCWSALFLVRD